MKEVSFQRAVKEELSESMDLGTPVILSSRSIQRPIGYRLQHDAIAVIVTLGNEIEEGYGEGENAFEKAVSEAIERCTLRIHRKMSGLTETSNGWAAHIDPDKAIEAALLELIERHVALTTWENGGPFFLVPHSLWPEELHAWLAEQGAHAEFCQPRVLLSSTKEGAAISTLLFNKNGNFVAGHASSLSLQDAIRSASRECMRAAHSVLRFEFFGDVAKLHAADFSSSVEPGAHSLAYAYDKTLPETVKLQEVDESQINQMWRTHLETYRVLRASALNFTMFHAGNRTIVRARCSALRQIYWGKSPLTHVKNLTPHFVG